MDIGGVFIYDIIHCIPVFILEWLIVYDYNFKVLYYIKLTNECMWRIF